MIAGRRAYGSPHVAGMTQRVPSRLRPHAQPVRLPPDLDAVREPPRLGIEHIHLVVVAAREPQLRTVGADVPHVGAATPGDRPGRHDTPVRGIEYGHGARPAPPACRRVPPAVRDVQPAPVAAGIDAMRALPR